MRNQRTCFRLWRLWTVWGHRKFLYPDFSVALSSGITTFFPPLYFRAKLVWSYTAIFQAVLILLLLLLKLLLLLLQILLLLTL